MKEKSTKLSCWTLFCQTFLIAAFAVGGGYVMISMLRERFVEKLGWIEEEDLASLIAIGQSGPGALIINTNSLIGYRLLGFKGAVSAALGTALPSLVAIMIISYFYELIRDNTYVSAAFRGMRSGVAAIIADTVVSMAQPYLKRGELLYACIMAAAFLAAFFFDVNVAFIILGCAVLDIFIGLVRRKRGAAQ